MPTLGTSGSEDGWENLSKQTARHTISLSGSDGPTGGSHLFEQAFELEPAGGLDREELAELVAIERIGLAEPSGGGPTGPTTLHVEWEDTMAPNAQIAGQSVQVATDADGVTGADLYETVNEDDPDTVDFWEVELTKPWEDSTNGTGGAGDGSQVMQQTVNFREMFGTGPILDRHDRIYSHVLESVTGAGWQIENFVQLYWDIDEK